MEYKEGTRKYTLHYVRGSDISKTYASEHPVIFKTIGNDDTEVLLFIKNNYPSAILLESSSTDEKSKRGQFYSKPYGSRNDSIHMIDTPYGKHSYLSTFDLGFRT